MNKIVTLLCIISFWAISCSSKKAAAGPDGQKTLVDYKNTYLIITDQSQNRIARVDLKTQSIVWEWKAATGIPAKRLVPSISSASRPPTVTPAANPAPPKICEITTIHNVLRYNFCSFSGESM